MVELLMTLVIGVIGFTGAFGIYTSTVKANMISREYDRARTVAEELMERLRHDPIASFEAGGVEVKLPLVTVEGAVVTFCPYTTVTSLTTNLVRIEVEVRYGEVPEGDDCDDVAAADLHRVRYELVRTRLEGL